jgi:ketosteroid isomerase-like protein
MSDLLDKWMAAYRAAWESNDPSDIGALFTDDAVYYNEPFTDPSRGREAIISSWLKRQDAPGSTTFTWSPLSVTDDVAIIQGETIYPDDRYSNLWVIRFAPSGEATEFTEWWMDQANPSGS